VIARPGFWDHPARRSPSELFRIYPRIRNRWRPNLDQGLIGDGTTKRSRSVLNASSENRSNLRLGLVMSRGAPPVNALHDKTVDCLKIRFPVRRGQRRSAALGLSPHSSPAKRGVSRIAIRGGRSEKMGCLIVAVQLGENQTHGRLLRELNICLRRYYARVSPALSPKMRRKTHFWCR
jgi:hypothetical protein